MKVNMGNIDRIFRIIVAIVIIALFATNVISGSLGIIGLAVAAIFIATSFMKFCPLYWPFKISTTGKKD